MDNEVSKPVNRSAELEESLEAIEHMMVASRRTISH